MKQTTTFAALAALGTILTVSPVHAATISFNNYLGDVYSSLAKFENLPAEDDVEEGAFLEAQAKRAYNNDVNFNLHALNVNGGKLNKTRFVQDSYERLAGIKSTLEAHMAQGTANTHPVPLANAMAHFDCWVEQQENEPNSRHNVNSCLPGLEAALAQLPALQSPAPVTQTVTQTQTANLDLLDTVYFAFDKSDLTQESRRKIDALESRVKRADRGEVVIVGHADRSGPVDYNQRLSERRAQAVAEYMNLPAGTFRVETDAKGETQPAVKTADGVKEQANRRVTISIDAQKQQVRQQQQVVE